MSKARNISNLFSGSTDAATDAEVTAAIATHAANTTARHYASGDTSSRPTSPNNGDLYTNTQTGFVEVYSGSTYGWEAVGAISSTVTGVTATDSPSGRVYNNGSASVAFTPGSVVGRSYTVTSSPGSYTATGSSSPLTVTGLQSSTQYTYTVIATNNYGTSSASSASSGVTATTVPQAPTIGTATGADSSATLTFTAGATGGATISNYKYSTDNSTYTAFSPAQTTSPLTISGLTNGQTYSFYLKAVNTNGDSSASSASNSVSIGSPTSFESIATVSVSSNTNTISFASIPSTYKHLQIRGMVRCSYTYAGTATGASAYKIQFNGDTGANYSFHALQGNGSTASANSTANSNQILGVAPWANVEGYTPGLILTPIIIDIFDYGNTSKNTTVKIMDGLNTNSTSTNQHVALRSGAWYNTSAVTSILLDATAGPWSDGPFAANTTFALYGIKGS